MMTAEIVLLLAGEPDPSIAPVRIPWSTNLTFRGKRVYLERANNPQTASRDIERFNEWVMHLQHDYPLVTERDR